MKITRPLIATAVGAGALGATLALGLTMASASTGSASSAAASHSAVKSTTSSPAAAPKPAKGSVHKCPGMSGGGTRQHSTAQG